MRGPFTTSPPTQPASLRSRPSRGPPEARRFPGRTSAWTPRATSSSPVPWTTGSSRGASIRGARSSVLSAGDVDVYARLFGTPNVGFNVASGQVFQDLNFNGAKDAGESGMSGQTVYRDDNANLTRDTGSYTSVRALSGLGYSMPIGTGRTRLYLGPGPGPAAGRVITDVDVALDINYPSVQRLTVTVISPG